MQQRSECEQDSHGSLVVTVMEARDLKQDSRYGKIDSYVALTIDSSNQTLRSRVVNDSPNPEFMDTLIFQGALENLYHSNLNVALFNKMNSSHPLGLVSIALNKLTIGREVTCWFDLSPVPEESELPSGGAAAAAGPAGTVRLALTLTGPLRRETSDVPGRQYDVEAAFLETSDVPGRQYDVEAAFLEVAAAATGAAAVAGAVDGALARLRAAGVGARPYLTHRYTLTAAVPLALLGALAFPALLALVTAGMPLLFPFFILWFLMTIVAGAATTVVAALSRPGREKLGAAVGPAAGALATTPAGQQLLYATGPRPGPGALVDPLIPTRVWYRLALSLLIDFLGNTSYLLPGLGEGADLVWAPTQALLLRKMYKDTVPWAQYVGFAEELLPFTDITPTATLAWLQENAPGLVPELRRLGVGFPHFGAGAAAAAPRATEEEEKHHEHLD